jgi:2-desacetyl-2-hydroxyethyl bacteriochlorophyllide A dehydrogenase
MRGMRLDAPHRWHLAELPDPVPERAEVVVDVVACGVCGTDLHTLAGTNPTVVLPVTPGHEFIGTVREVGAAVTDLAPGTRVAVDPSRSCGACRFCRGGHANLCPDKGGYGSRYPGGLAAKVAVRRDACVEVPAGVSWRAAVLAEPLACVLHGIERVGPVLGSRALVLGGGTIGLLVAAVLGRAGARVTVSEPVERRRGVAAELGVRDLTTPDALDRAARWDVVVDASGVASVIELGGTLLDRGGTLLIMGVAEPGDRISIAPATVNWHELNIIGSASINATFARAVDLLTHLGTDLERIVTAEFAIGDLAAAFAAVRARDAIKVVVLPNGVPTW